MLVMLFCTFFNAVIHGLHVVVAGCGAAQRASPAVINTRPSQRAAAGDDSRAENHPCSTRASGAHQEQQE